MAIASTASIQVGPAISTQQWAAKYGIKLPAPKPTVQTTTARPAPVRTTTSAGMRASGGGGGGVAFKPAGTSFSSGGMNLPFFPYKPPPAPPKEDKKTEPAKVAAAPSPTLFDIGPPAEADPGLGQRTPAMENLIKQFAQRRIY